MIKVTDIRFLAQGWRALILFQSIRQFFSYVSCVALVIALVSGIGYLFFGFKNVTGDAVFLGFLGAIPSVLLARKTSFDILGAERMRACSFIEKKLQVFGFVKIADDGSSSTYQKKLPDILRWNESNLTVFLEPTHVRIVGPQGTLISLRKALLKSIN